MSSPKKSGPSSEDLAAYIEEHAPTRGAERIDQGSEGQAFRKVVEGARTSIINTVATIKAKRPQSSSPENNLHALYALRQLKESLRSLAANLARDILSYEAKIGGVGVIEGTVIAGDLSASVRKGSKVSMKRDEAPQVFEAIAERLNLPDAVKEFEVLRLHEPGVQAYAQHCAAEGEPLPLPTFSS